MQDTCHADSATINRPIHRQGMSGKRRAPAGSPEDLSRRRESAQGSSLPGSPPIQRRQASHRLVAPLNSDVTFVAPPRSQQLHIPKQQQSTKVAIPRLSRDVDAPLSSPGTCGLEHAVPTLVLPLITGWRCISLLHTSYILPPSY